MAKPPTNPVPVVRKVMALPIPRWGRVNDWRFGQHIGTEVEAIRRLIEAGLEAEARRAMEP